MSVEAPGPFPSFTHIVGGRGRKKSSGSEIEEYSWENTQWETTAVAAAAAVVGVRFHVKASQIKSLANENVPIVIPFRCDFPLVFGRRVLCI